MKHAKRLRRALAVSLAVGAIAASAANAHSMPGGGSHHESGATVLLPCAPSCGPGESIAAGTGSLGSYEFFSPPQYVVPVSLPVVPAPTGGAPQDVPYQPYSPVSGTEVPVTGSPQDVPYQPYSPVTGTEVPVTGSPQDVPYHPYSPRNAPEPVPTVPVSVPVADGFDWSDAGIGVAVAAGLALLAGGMAVAVRGRDRLATS
jgi:hypothetical protein